MQKLACRTVKNVIETVAICLYQQLAHLAVEARIYQYRDLRPIPIHYVVGGELEVPFQLSGIQVDRDHGVGIKVIALAHIAVEIGRGIADAPIEQVQLRIVATREPGRPAAMLPGVISPGISAGFTRLRYGVKSPQMLAGFCVECGQKAIEPAVTVDNANQHLTLSHQRRRGRMISLT